MCAVGMTDVDTAHKYQKYSNIMISKEFSFKNDYTNYDLDHKKLYM